MQNHAFPYKSAQIVAGSAIAMALLGGAFAVGRSGASGAAAPEAAPAGSAVAAHKAPPEAKPALDNLCDRCARVTEVHTESRRGSASGVGAVGGAVVGGVLGSLVGGGNGKKLATVAGAVGGGYAGNEIEKNQNRRQVWVVELKQRDGRVRHFERSSDPGVRVGDEVELRDGGFQLR